MTDSNEVKVRTAAKCKALVLKGHASFRKEACDDSGRIVFVFPATARADAYLYDAISERINARLRETEQELVDDSDKRKNWQK